MPDSMDIVEACDVVVAGAGIGGLSAAVTAAVKGLTVVVLEKEPFYGGAAATSAGRLWIPCNPVAARAGVGDSRDAALTYFKHATGNRFDAARVGAFLDKAPEMVSFLETQTNLTFILSPLPDYHSEAPGASKRGRTLYAPALDGRALGREVERLRPPRKELTLFGAQIPPEELRHFMNVYRSMESAGIVARRLLRYMRDLVIHGRSLDLENGNALMARLAMEAFQRGVSIRTSASVTELVRDSDGVAGVRYRTADGASVTLRARKGVVLACGGWAHDIRRRREIYRHAPSGQEHHSVMPVGNTGDGIRMAERIGGAFDADVSDAAVWTPVSLAPKGGGGTDVFPHFMDRPKPGFIAVTRQGRRFVNESDSYHDFIRGMLKACADEPKAQAFLIADHRAVRRYGLGVAKPSPFPLAPHIRSGYLMRGATLDELAAKAGIDPAGLAATVESFNRHARLGKDPEFGRGDTAYNRAVGDLSHRPNPCMAPVEAAPFYAVKIYPGDIGTYCGLKTDRRARVLDRDGAAIPGLYAVGSDMLHIMGGDYMGGGAMIGPAMTFGYIAGCDLAAPDAG